MVERLLVLKSDDLNNDNDKGSLRKGQSFNTDDDESLAADSIQPGEDDPLKASTSDLNSLSPLDIKRSLLSLSSPSMDSINDPEGSVSDNPITEKKKRRSRRTFDRSEVLDLKRPSIRKRPWYTKLDFTKPLIGVALLIIAYLMWVERDIWIPRLLTSNTRLRHTIMRNDEKLQERGELSQTSKNLTSSIDEDDIINEKDDKKTNYDNDNLSNDDNDDDSPVTYNKPSSQTQKLNLRTRRNKMSFSRDRSTKRRRGTTSQTIDGDDDDDDLDDDDDVDDDDDDIDSGTNSDTDNPKNNAENLIKPKESVLSSSSHSSKRHRHHQHNQNHRSDRSNEQKTKHSSNTKTNLILRSRDDIVDQLYKLIKAHGKNRDLSALLTRQTGLNKSKINRFIYQKDFSQITIQQLIAILNAFDTTILIVPK